MKEVGAYEAKTHLANLLDEVGRGERIVITRHGVPVAMLIPIVERAIVEPVELIQEIKKSRKNVKLGSSSRTVREAGRRF